MQSKHQIQHLFSREGIWPRKNLGQNFLIDLNLLQLLVNSACIERRDCVLEVGCGTGSLTVLLAERAGRVVAVEVDGGLAKIAKQELAGFENVEVINTDILESKHTLSKVVLEAVGSGRLECSGRFLLVANLPYNVGCPVMMNLVTGNLTADAMFVTVQKEVAERMCAGVGSRCYGTLSIILSAVGDVKMMRVLKPSVFWPQPEVDSAMVSFIRSTDKAERITDLEFFCGIVGLFMGHRRKMLKSCVKFAEGKLAGIDNWDEIFERCEIEPTNRPGQMRPEDYIAISNQAVLRLNKA